MKLSVLAEKLNRVISDLGDLNWPVDWLFSKQLLELFDNQESSPDPMATKQPSTEGEEDEEVVCGCGTAEQAIDGSPAAFENPLENWPGKIIYGKNEGHLLGDTFEIKAAAAVSGYPDLSEEKSDLITGAAIEGKVRELVELLYETFDYSLEVKISEEGEEIWELFSNKRAIGVVAQYSNLNEAQEDLCLVLEGQNILNPAVPDVHYSADSGEIIFTDEESN